MLTRTWALPEPPKPRVTEIGATVAQGGHPDAPAYMDPGVGAEGPQLFGHQSAEGPAL